MITISNLSHAFDPKYDVLSEVNYEIKNGRIVGLVGINGAGKSTLLRLLSGVYEISRGSVSYDGLSPANEECRQDIFFLSDDPYYTHSDTLDSIFKMYQVFYPNMDRALFDEILGFFKLNPKKPVRSFSKGMRRQGYVALSFAIAPKYLYLDEAFDGLDPKARAYLKDYIVKLVKEKGITVIISSHSLLELEGLCDEIVMLDGQKLTPLDKTLESSKRFKLQIVLPLKEGETYEMLFERAKVEVTNVKVSASVVTAVFNGDVEDVKTKLSVLNPMLIEEIDLSYEERFIDFALTKNAGGDSNGN